MKNTKELVVGFIAMAALMAESFKDGIQAADALAIWAKIQSNPALMEKLMAAYTDVDQISTEVKEVSAEEVLEVIVAALPEIRNLMLALKK